MKKPFLIKRKKAPTQSLFSMFKFLTLAIALLLFGVGGVQGQISITTLPYSPATENFNSYDPNNASNAASTIPAGWSYSGAANYRGQGTGTGTSGGFYSFGTSGDFSIGALRSSSNNYTYSVNFTNNSGQTITKITLAWNYEQWRFANTSGWNCSGIGQLASNTVLDGKDFTGSSSGTNGTVNTTAIASFDLTGLSIVNGQSFGITWTTTDATSSDNGVSIDDFVISCEASTSSPIITSSAATSITTTGATLNGNVTSDGGSAVTDRGFVFNTSSGVTISDNKTTVAGTTGAYTLAPTLAVNTHYYFKSYAINSIGTTLSSPELDFYTLANAPGTPTVNNPTVSTLDVTLNVNSNPSNTEFAIQETGGNYVQANGTLGGSPVWQTASSWGTPIVVGGLSASTLYTFQVKARNGANTETSFGSTASGTTSTPSSPVISVSGSLSAVNTIYGTASASPSNFTAYGAAMTTGITVTPPVGYEVCLASDFSSTIGTNASPLTFGAAGTITNTDIYVRLAATATVSGSPYSGNIVLSSTGASNENVATVSSSVSTKELTITGLTGANKVYDGTTSASFTGTAAYSGLENSESFTVTGSPSATFADKIVGTAKSITVIGYTAPSTNYTVTQPAGLTGNITAINLTVASGATVSNKAYDGTTDAVVSAGTLSAGVVIPDVVSISTTGIFANANVGTGISVDLALTGADAGNYTLTQPGRTADITQASQTITFGALASKTTADAAFDLTATASSGLSVTYISSNLSVATISGVTVTIVGAGTTTITASQAGNSNYSAASDVDQALTVTAGPVNIAIQDFETSPASPTLTYTTNSSGATITGTSASGDRPATSNFYTSANTAWNANNESSLVTFSNITGLATYTSKVFEFRLSSFSIGSTGNGADASDIVTVEVSIDGGSNWSSELRVLGNSNANWDYSATGIATVTCDGNNSPTNFQPIGGGNRTSDGYSTIRINLSDLTSQAQFRITLLNNAAAEKWIIDDAKLTGTLSSNPVISVSSLSLSGFTQTSSTPSSEQSYTVSGDNLTASVSIAPPTGFEISTTTGGSFSATNPIVLTQSGGNLVGEPVTIYVRQSSSSLGAVTGNIEHTSTGATQADVALSGTRTGTYYYDGSGDLDVLTNWGLNTDGSGANPANFTSDGAIYEIRNAATATIGAAWTVSGTSSKVVVGDGTNATDFTIPSGFALTGTIDVSNNAELTVENTTSPTIGTLATNSTLEYNNVAVTLSAATTYRNLKLTGSGTKTFPGGTVTITGNLTLNGTTLDGASGSPFSTILLEGDLTYVGSVTAPADANSITLSTNGTASGTQTFTGAGNTLRWFRITTTTANTVLLSTVGGSSNLNLGNLSGGGITLFDGSVLNMNGNDFQLFNSSSFGSAAFIMTTGTISTNSATDFTIERTVSGALGTLRFTTGSNTIGNLTLNHTGATNTLIIGNELNVVGSVAITDGVLQTGGNLTLKSNASGTASIGQIGAGGSISGNITAERYIPAQRKFRFLASPVVGATAAQWRDNGGSTSGIGLQITGTGGASNGFDVSTSNASSAFTYTEANGEITNTTIGGADNAGWTAFSSGSQALTNGQGYRVLVRGDRTISLTTTPAPAANNTTISVTGSYPSSPVTINVTRASDLAGKGWSLVGNPFPSAISWNAITKSLEMTGAYQTFNPTTNAYVSWNGATGDATDNISSGQGFLVFVTSGSSYTSGSITIEEADKVSGNGGSFFKTSLKNHLKVSMKYDSNNVNNTFIHFRDQANELFDPAFDAPKLTNPGVNLASKDAKGNYYSINSLPVSALNDTRVVPLSVLNSVEATYTFEFNDVNSFDGQEIYLEDKFTNTTTQLTEGKKYTFTLSSDKASSNDGRFNLVFNKKVTGLDKQTSQNNFLLFPNPASEFIQISLINTNNGDYRFEIYNQLGANIKSGNLDFNTNRDQTIGVDELSTGVYFIKVYNGQSTQTIKFIK